MTSALPMFKFLDKVENGIAVEIGVDKGYNLKNMVMNLRNFKKFYGVDPWNYNLTRKWGEQHRNMALGILQNDILNGKVELIQKTSEEAVADFEDESIDFIWIDGNHDYEPVLLDITLWLPKLKKGAFMGGHDYKDSEPGVQKAVEKVFGKDYTFLEPDCWSYKK